MNSRKNFNAIRGRLTLPVVVAPMFLVSGPEMVIAARRCGLVGSFPAPNARNMEILDDWLSQITQSVKEEPGCLGTWSMNLVVHQTYKRLKSELELVQKYKPPIVITALGSPKDVVEVVQDYGGFVIADVSSIEYARKAADMGVDGLALVSAGAGGHTGKLSGFTFLPAVREFFDGIVIYAGGVGTGDGVLAAEILGADLVYMGTGFIATEESQAKSEYKNMLVASGPNDFVLTNAFTGADAYYLRESLIQCGFDPGNLSTRTRMDFGGSDDQVSAWKDIWSAGPIAQLIKRVEPLADVAGRLSAEYQQARWRT